MIDRLFTASDALTARQAEAATAQLADPIFTFGPKHTLAALAHLPPLPDRQWAFADFARNDDRSAGTPKGIIWF